MILALVAQVLYLDSIDTGVMNMVHHSFPRVRHFDQSIMRLMILTDTVRESSDVTKGAFGNSKVCNIQLMVGVWRWIQ
jgi:hypothetical protein